MTLQTIGTELDRFVVDVFIVNQKQISKNRNVRLIYVGRLRFTDRSLFKFVISPLQIHPAQQLIFFALRYRRSGIFRVIQSGILAHTESLYRIVQYENFGTIVARFELLRNRFDKLVPSRIVVAELSALEVHF